MDLKRRSFTSTGVAKATLTMLLLLIFCCPGFSRAGAKDKSGLELAVRMSDSEALRRPKTWQQEALTGGSASWNYERGLVAFSFVKLWEKTGDVKYFKYAQNYADRHIKEGIIEGYKAESFNIDNINLGKFLFSLYRETGDERYKRGIFTLREQLKGHPRTSEGGFWHKLVYPHQMWLDGLYMGAPFYAQFAKEFGQPELFDDVINQFVLVNGHTFDPETGLNYHGWDESKEQIWADPVTGCSPNFWGRAMGWYAMALVDALDYIPESHPGYPQMTAILEQVASGIKKYQDPASGLWYQVLDQGEREGNYLEASASAMFVYTLLKATRLKLIDKAYRNIAVKGYEGMKNRFIRENEDGTISLTSICRVAGLSKTRDGSFGYYISEPVVDNDPKGVGPFILASIEVALKDRTEKKTVGLDNWYNHEINGKTGEVYHYTWNDRAGSGFSQFGDVFVRNEARLETVSSKPRKASLSELDIYIIVDPDTPSETHRPNYIMSEEINTIFAWVKKGGVLLLMANDGPNCEFTHFNQLAETFGFHFNPVTLNPVANKKWEMGAETGLSGHPIFKGITKIYMKEVASISISRKAKAVLLDGEGENIFIAETRFGKGYVLAVGDPWLYNEYIGHDLLPRDFENLKAAGNLCRHLLSQVKK